MINYLSEHYIEIIGVIISLIYLFLSIQQKIGLWFFGILSSAMYAWIYFDSKFYADMSLQFYYIFVSIYGWINWSQSKSKQGIELPVLKVTGRQMAGLSFISVVIFLIYYFILSEYTDSPLPIADSITTALSITATWMLARKIMEHWLLWIFIDGLSAGLYFYKELYPTFVLFIIYTVMAFWGYIQWQKTLSKQHC